MANIESNQQTHEDYSLIVQLAQQEGVEADRLIEESDLLDSLAQFHEVRQMLRENALSLTPCEKFEKEMIENEQRLTQDRIKESIRIYRKRLVLRQISEQEMAA